jgi:gliding motility-associated-like protein
MRLRLFIVFMILLFFPAEKISATAPTTKGTEFWFSFMDNLDLSSNGPPVFTLEITCDVNTNGVIALPVTGFTQTFAATAGQVTEIILPAGVFYHIGSESSDNCGFRVTSDNPISLRVMHHRLYFSDATIVLPITELGNDYMVIAHDDDIPVSGGMSEFVVVATEDNTTLDITPSTFTIGFHPAGIPFSTTINKGQIYQVQAYGDLTGSAITARNNKKIAVFSGAKYADVACGATNHVYDEDYPTASWGNEYVVCPFIRTIGTLFRILSKENGTLVYFNCNNPLVINKGKYLDTILFVPAHIVSSHPVAVGQFKLGQSCSSKGDCSFFMNTPIALCSHKAVFAQIISLAGSQFSDHYANVITQTANTSLVTFDNASVTFYPVPSNPSWSYANLPITSGPHTLLSDSGFYAYAFGVGDYDGYTYLLGYDDVHQYTSSLTVQGTDTICNATQANFTASATFSVSSWNWNFGDGGSSSQQNPAYTYGQNGNYLVTLLVTDASGCPSIASENVLVSDCMEGFDCELFVPTAFSPNHDGVNDSVGVYGTCLKEIEFTIYDRWGEIVFQTTDKSKFWDGTYKGQALDNSVFAWTLKATSYSGLQVSRKGNITLIK